MDKTYYKLMTHVVSTGNHTKILTTHAELEGVGLGTTSASFGTSEAIGVSSCCLAFFFLSFFFFPFSSEACLEICVC